MGYFMYCRMTFYIKFAVNLSDLDLCPHFMVRNLLGWLSLESWCFCISFVHMLYLIGHLWYIIMLDLYSVIWQLPLQRELTWVIFKARNYGLVRTKYSQYMQLGGNFSVPLLPYIATATNFSNNGALLETMIALWWQLAGQPQYTHNFWDWSFPQSLSAFPSSLRTTITIDKVRGIWDIHGTPPLYNSPLAWLLHYAINAPSSPHHHHPSTTMSPHQHYHAPGHGHHL